MYALGFSNGARKGDRETFPLPQAIALTEALSSHGHSEWIIPRNRAGKPMVKTIYFLHRPRTASIFRRPMRGIGVSAARIILMFLASAAAGCAPCGPSNVQAPEPTGRTTTWETRPGGTAPAPLAAVLGPTLPEVPTAVFTPEAFGAVPDDGRDDGPALQAAFDAAAAEPGSLVRLSVGTYDIRQMVRLGSYTALAGEGPGSVLRGHFRGPAVLTTRDDGVEHVLVRDLRVSGARSPIPNQGGTCVSMYRARYFLVERLTVDDCEKYGIWAVGLDPHIGVDTAAFGTVRHNVVRDTRVGIETTTAEDVWIVENTVELTAGHTESGLHPTEGSLRILLERNTVTGAGGMGVWIHQSSDITLVDNRVSSCESAIVVSPRSYGPEGYGTGVSDRVRVEGGVYRSAGDAAVRLDDCLDCQIVGAEIQGWIQTE